jgi:murein DD-endopeptidase MepM/ murein hydrolase activator NlpD
MPEPPPPTQPAVTLGDPIGTIGGDLHIAFGRGADWSKINRYDALFLAAGTKHGVPPQMLKAMAVIESGGEMIWNQGGSGAFGIMQFKRNIWQPRAAAFGYSLNTPEGQIGMAAAILGGDVGGVPGNTPEERFLSTYYPTAGLDVPGEDGATPRQYLADMHELMRQIDAAAGGTTPAPQPKPEPQGDVLDLLFGGKPYTITATYGQLVTWSCPGCYDYFTDYGLDTRHHWAYDVVAAAGDGAPLYAPFDGTVVCAGTGVGSGAWGTGCAAFPRDNNYGGKPSGVGAGRLELLHADGKRSLILGHVLSSRPNAGDRVKQGDLIGQQGGMNASHVHAEGRYANGTRIGDPRKLFGGGPLPIVYADRVPIPQPSDWDGGPTVTITQDGVKLLQRARKDAAEVASPFAKGDTFEAVMLVYSEDDDDWYWVTQRSTRIPIHGTTSALLGDR